MKMYISNINTIFNEKVIKRLNSYEMKPKPGVPMLPWNNFWLGHSPWSMANVFSMAVVTIGEWLKLVPFLLGDVQLILWGGGVAVF